MSRDVVLSVKDLRKIYPGKNPFVAVDGINFELKKGEVLGLLGPNGAGKTTTIQMLLSTLTPSSGTIVYFGKNFAKYRSEILHHVVFASTYISVPWALTIEQNLNIFGRLYGMRHKELEKRRDELLDRFGILSKLKQKVSSLSAGQVTRLVLAKAFLSRPKIALLDEPTASLDPDIAKDILQFVVEQKEKEGTSILFTSHKMAEAAEVCDRILFLQNGKIIADDVPKKLARSAAKSRLQLVLVDGMKRTLGLIEKMGLNYTVSHRTLDVEVDEEMVAKILLELAKNDVIYSGIQIIQPTLEDYFLKMVKKR